MGATASPPTCEDTAGWADFGQRSKQNHHRCSRCGHRLSSATSPSRSVEMRTVISLMIVSGQASWQRFWCGAAKEPGGHSPGFRARGRRRPQKGLELGRGDVRSAICHTQQRSAACPDAGSAARVLSGCHDVMGAPMTPLRPCSPATSPIDRLLGATAAGPQTCPGSHCHLSLSITKAD